MPDVRATPRWAAACRHPGAVAEPRFAWDTGTTLELVRMVIRDVTTKNAESKALGFAARYIKKQYPHIARLIAYNDIEGQGHKGTIYKASGWILDANTTPQSWASRPGRVVGELTNKLRWRKDL